MSALFKFGLAGAAEDSALRAVLRQVSMPGDISLAFHREPSFFIAEQAGNIKSQTLVYQDEESGRIVGVGGRSMRLTHVDGDKKVVGYLSMLRLLPEARGGTVLVRGYKHLRLLHSDGEAPYYFTTIFSENTHAQSALESGRAGLPTYAYIGTLSTYMIPLSKRRRLWKTDERVIVCDEDSLLSAQKCLEGWNSRFQFAPSYSMEDLSGCTNLLPNFSLKDFYVYRERDAVIGTFGVWDQGSFKQTIVTGYSAAIKVAKPFYNGLARLRGWPLLPKIGEKIKSVYAAFMSSDNDDVNVFESLLIQACSDWSGKGYDYLLVGLCDGNPFQSVAASFANRKIDSKIYLVHWPEDKVVLPESSRTVHLEIATL